jgi:hypothetical protein
VAIDFPTSPSNNTMVPGRVAGVVTGVNYTARSSQWRDIRGRADADNRLINGSFLLSVINGNTSGTVDGLYMADMWNMYRVTDTGVCRGQRLSLITPKGNHKRLRITIETADTTLVAGEYATFSTAFEGLNMADLKFGTANAVPVVLRFGWKSPAGTYCVALRNQPITRSYVMWWTVSAGQANTDIEVVFPIPGETSGVWSGANNVWGWLDWSIFGFNSTPLNTAFSWLTGSFSRVPMTNGAATVGNIFEIFDVGFYADPNYTGLAPEWETTDDLDETFRCERYLTLGVAMHGIVGSATTVARLGHSPQVPMRTNPTHNFNGSPAVYDGTGFPAITAINATYSTPLSYDVDVTCAAGGLTATRNAGMYYTNYGNDRIRVWADIS